MLNAADGPTFEDLKRHVRAREWGKIEPQGDEVILAVAVKGSMATVLLDRKYGRDDKQGIRQVVLRWDSEIQRGGTDETGAYVFLQEIFAARPVEKRETAPAPVRPQPKVVHTWNYEARDSRGNVIMAVFNAHTPLAEMWRAVCAAGWSLWAQENGSLVGWIELSGADIERRIAA